MVCFFTIIWMWQNKDGATFFASIIILLKRLLLCCYYTASWETAEPNTGVMHLRATPAGKQFFRWEESVQCVLSEREWKGRKSVCLEHTWFWKRHWYRDWKWVMRATQPWMISKHATSSNIPGMFYKTMIAERAQHTNTLAIICLSLSQCLFISIFGNRSWLEHIVQGNVLNDQRAFDPIRFQATYNPSCNVKRRQVLLPARLLIHSPVTAGWSLSVMDWISRSPRTITLSKFIVLKKK